jgi:serine/threonine protein kinase
MVARFMPLDQSDPVEIAGYQVRARIGSGGMGNVYLSFTRGGRPVALKVVRKEFADDPEFRRRFRQEVAAAQRVQGLYTAPVVDADPDAPVPWLATAYIAGPSLSSAVAEYGPFPELSVFRLLGGVAEGLSAIHAVGLVHRDLKPANVLLAADGPRVIDFGIAHAADASALTGTGVIMGTPAFMTPEQVMGKPVSPATDVFALGHLALYAATGHSAFGDGHQSAIVYRIANEAPDLAGCPDSMRDLVARCLAKEPADRPDLAGIIDFARAGLAGQTMHGASESWLPDPLAGALAAYQTIMAPAPAGQTHPPTSGVTPTTVPPSGAPMVPVTRLDSPSPDGPGYPPTGPTNPQPRRRGPVRPAIVVPVVLVLLAAAAGGAYLAGQSKGETPPPKTDAAGHTPAARAHATETSTAGAASLAGATASRSTSPSAPSSPSATTTASAPAANAGEYSTPEPFPLCDPNDAQWNLVNLTPQSANGCAPGMTVAVTNSDGFGYGTTSKFPNGTPIASSNTVTLSSNLPGNGGYQNWCMGVTEGSAAAGYFAYMCNTGTWSIKSVIGLGTNGVILGKELASGTLPFTGGTSYDLSLAFKPGSATMTIALTQGGGSPLEQTVKTAVFTPTAVGYGFENDNPTIPINPSYPAVGGFVYTVG